MMTAHNGATNPPRTRSATESAREASAREHHRRLDRGRRVSEVLRQRTQRAQFGRHGIGGCVDASGEALEGEARLGGVFRCAQAGPGIGCGDHRWWQTAPSHGTNRRANPSRRRPWPSRAFHWSSHKLPVGCAAREYYSLYHKVYNCADRSAAKLKGRSPRRPHS